MVRTASTMLPLGTTAPDFELSDFDGKLVKLSDLTDGKGLLVIFMCNHCPYVKHVAPELARLGNDYQPRGLKIVGISSNDADAYPDDSPEMMKQEASQQGYTFPYLYDATQAVATAYCAACTPDFYLFDAQQKLVYRGQLDSTRPKQDQTPDGRDLRQAIDALLAGQEIPAEQKPSIGCNIKWKPGGEPDYFKSA